MTAQKIQRKSSLEHLAKFTLDFDGRFDEIANFSEPKMTTEDIQLVVGTFDAICKLANEAIKEIFQ